MQLQTAISTSIGAAQDTFAATRTATGWRLEGGGVRAAFDGREAELGASGGLLSMALAGFGPSHRLSSPGPAAVSASANRVVYRYRGVREWYAAGPLGVEQGFVIEHRPVGADGALTLAMKLKGTLRAIESRSQIWFVQSSGRIALRYGGLLALDASGKRLPVEIRVHGQQLLVQVDGRNAHYPLRIDPLIQQGFKLIGSAEDGKGLLGYSAALSQDGNTAIVGGVGSGDTVGEGAAWVFVRSGGVWKQQGPKLTDSEALDFGDEVAVSGDGNTALVGALANNLEGGNESAFVYTRSGGAWTRREAPLIGGPDVAISADGNTALLANGLGARVYTHVDEEWRQQGGELTGANEVNNGSDTVSLALSADGDTAVIGRPGDNNYIGAVWVFTRSGNSWSQQGEKIIASEESGADHFGGSVALSGDGSTALIGGTFIDGAWIYTRSGSTWEVGPKLVPTVYSGSNGGVALSSDGDEALVGSGPNVFPEASWLGWRFTRVGSSWADVEGLEPSDWAGSSEGGIGGTGKVALSGDGETALFGRPEDGNLTGAAWVFSLPAPSCTNIAVSDATSGGTVTMLLSCAAPAGAALEYSITSSPAHGTLSPIDQTNGLVTYTPQSGYSGQDQFTFQVADQWGLSSPATASITIPSAVTEVSGKKTTTNSTRKVIPAVAPFVPLLLVRASIHGAGLGELVGLAAVRGAVAGDTIVLRCLAGCTRQLRLTVHLRRTSRARRRSTFAPLIVTRATEIEVDVSAPGRTTRFARYRFARRKHGLSVLVAARGCRSATGAAEACP